MVYNLLWEVIYFWSDTSRHVKQLENNIVHWMIKKMNLPVMESYLIAFLNDFT